MLKRIFDPRGYNCLSSVTVQKAQSQLLVSTNKLLPILFAYRFEYSLRHITEACKFRGTALCLPR